MLQEQPKPLEPPWSECFTVSTPALAASVASGDGPADIWLAQSGRKEFRLHSKFICTGVTDLEGNISPDGIANIRSVDPTSLPSTDLTSVPGPRRGFVNTCGAHTTAALIHDRLIEIENGPSDLTDVLADRYSRVILEAVGIRLRRWMTWAAAAFRTTRPAVA
jgi:hypothetical protein